MLLPSTIENKLGFDKILELIMLECQGPLGVQFAENLKFSRDFQYIVKLHSQTDEFLNILRAAEPFPSAKYKDMNYALKRAEIVGSYLDEQDFHELSKGLILLKISLDFFVKRQEDFPELYALGKNLMVPDDFLKELARCIDDSGQMKGSATPTLAKIRNNIFATQSRVRKVLDSVLREARGKGYVPDDATYTIRGGRMVIPVLSEHKRHLKGFIHDESATGQTVYMEPTAVLELNNELRDLELQEKKEIIRILISLTYRLRPYTVDLQNAYKVLGLFDFIRAKARFGIKVNGVCPTIEHRPCISWKNAVHPLLFIAHKAMGKAIVSQDIELDSHNRILLISGPNAGGKSVTLKTAGLLQYMIQCGIPVPLSDESIAGIFNQIFLDIGDEQSIENDLSTYSSHLTSMKKFIDSANKRTLVLIDEFGTGTEPEFGGAIAEAILEELNKRKSYGVITTHYANLKELAEKTPGIRNAAMQFDLENLEPLYKLQIGKPGSSFALEIAGKIGLDAEVIANARTKIGTERVNYDKVLIRLEKEKGAVERLKNQLATTEKRLATSSEEYVSLKTYLEVEKKNIINQAKEEAALLLKNANQKIEATIRKIKEVKGEKEATKEIRTELKSFEETIKPKEKKPKVVKKQQVFTGPIQPGDIVEIADSGAVAQVISVKGNNVEVMIGQLKSNVKLGRLKKVGAVAKNAKSEVKSGSSKSGINYASEMAEFSSQLDLRGKRGEEAMPDLDRFMDRALLLNQDEVRILHGKGDGILRQLVRSQLKSLSFVKSMRDEHADFGGAGVTIVALK